MPGGFYLARGIESCKNKALSNLGLLREDESKLVKAVEPSSTQKAWRQKPGPSCGEPSTLREKIIGSHGKLERLHSRAAANVGDSRSVVRGLCAREPMSGK